MIGGFSLFCPVFCRGEKHFQPSKVVQDFFHSISQFCQKCGFEIVVGVKAPATSCLGQLIFKTLSAKIY